MGILIGEYGTYFSIRKKKRQECGSIGVQCIAEPVVLYMDGINAAVCRVGNEDQCLCISEPINFSFQSKYVLVTVA